MGMGKKLLTRVGSGNILAMLVTGRAFSGTIWVRKKFFKQSQMFQFLPPLLKNISPIQVKKYSGWPLIYCGQTCAQVGSGRVGSWPISTTN